MNRLEFETEIEELLDKACDELKSTDFVKLLEAVKDMVENYE